MTEHDDMPEYHDLSPAGDILGHDHRTTDLPLVLEFEPETRKLIATNQLSKDEDGESQIVAFQCARWFGLWAESAWRQEFATPDAAAGLRAALYTALSVVLHETLDPDCSDIPSYDETQRMAERVLAMPNVAAILATPDAAAGLDVERLAAANYRAGYEMLSVTDRQYVGDIVAATAIAAEYEKAE